MQERKNSLLLFSKVPEAGRVKTRLTHLKDGIFEPEVASVLYHCMLFDVTETCCVALTELERRAAERAEATGVLDTYELVISTTPVGKDAEMRALYEASGTWPREIVFACDQGASFDEHYNDAFSQCFARGAQTVLSMGCDMPALTSDDVVRGFEALRRIDDAQKAGEERFAHGGIVLAPDQELGVSVIGWTAGTEFDHSGVFYNKTGLTVLPAYVGKAREKGLPALYLPPVPDVDTMADFMHNITLVEALCYCKEPGGAAPWRTQNALKEMGWDEVRIPPNDLLDPRDAIDK